MKSCKKPKFLRPPQKDRITKNRRKAQTVDEFAEQADYITNENLESDFPWQKVNNQEKKALPLYLPKDSYEKLKYLSDNTDVPQQKILRSIIIPEVDKRIEKILNDM